MKIFLELISLIAFFVTYLLYDIYTAVAVLMVVFTLQITLTWLITRHVEKVHLISLALLLILGGATLVSRDINFIKWKPTVLYLILTLVLFVSHYWGKKPILQRLLEKFYELTPVLWRRVNASWAIFFAFLGVINLYVAYQFELQTWVTFKVFGAFGLTLVFAIVQGLALNRYIKDSDNLPPKDNTS